MAAATVVKPPMDYRPVVQSLAVGTVFTADNATIVPQGEFSFSQGAVSAGSELLA